MSKGYVIVNVITTLLSLALLSAGIYVAIHFLQGAW